MGKFTRKGKGGMPAISTASLPDIIFMLLFFFMVSTTMRKVDLKVDIKLPESTEIQKLEDKSLVTYIYVGKPVPSLIGTLGDEPRIQLNDQFQPVSGILPFILAKKESLNASELARMTVSIKCDADTKMGIVSDIKEQLRMADALKINYATTKKK